MDLLKLVLSLLQTLGILAKPVVEEHYIQLYNNEHTERLAYLDELLKQPDSADRARRIGTCINGLCLSAGVPTGPISDTSIELPVSHFVALATIASGAIRDREVIARISFVK